jgi:uncharacterized protein
MPHPRRRERTPRRDTWKRRWRRLYLSQAPRRRKLKGGFLHRLLGDRLFDHRLWKPERGPFAGGLGVGLAVGLLPTYWFQAVLAFLASYVLRLNATAAVLGTFITNPFTTPGIVLLQYRLGVWMVGGPDPDAYAHLPAAVRAILGHGKPYLVGSMVSAVLCGLLGYVAVLLLWDLGSHLRPHSRPRRPVESP